MKIITFQSIKKWLLGISIVLKYITAQKILGLVYTETDLPRLNRLVYTECFCKIQKEYLTMYISENITKFAKRSIQINLRIS